MSLFFFILGLLGALYSGATIMTTSSEKLQDDNHTGAKLMAVLVCSLLMIGLNATEISNNQLVIDFFTP